MMHGDAARSNPTVQVLPWDLPLDDPTANNMPSPFSVNHNTNTTSPSGDFDGMAALHRYLPSNTPDFQIDEDGEDPVYAFSSEHFRMFEFKVRKCARGRYLPSNTPDFQIDEDGEVPVDAFSSEHFRMFEFKVRKCARGRSHDWLECPYAHPGETSRRRDPRRFQYSGTPCPEFRKGYCNKGDSCDFAHGVFECWLHPSRYRTQPCEDGTHCRRRVCFFAHTPDQLRVLPHHGSPRLGDSCDGHRVDSVTTRTPRRGHSGRRRPRLRIPRQFRRRLTRHNYFIP